MIIHEGSECFGFMMGFYMLTAPIATSLRL